jgi:hypothetical protein
MIFDNRAREKEKGGIWGNRTASRKDLIQAFSLTNIQVTPLISQGARVTGLCFPVVCVSPGHQEMGVCVKYAVINCVYK